MNIHRMTRRKRRYSCRKTYAGFIMIGGMFCIILAALLWNGGLPAFHRKQKDITANKSVRYGATEHGGMPVGQFLTHYRFMKFGTSDPNDVDPTAPMIAFTFDDGPNPESTKRILDVLSANYSHATFFVVGSNAEKYPDTLKDILTCGCEIGNHTYNHADLTSLSKDKVEQEIGDTNRAVKKATGEKTTVIRPPYGAYNDKVMKQLEEPIILWNRDTEDWSSRNAQTVVAKVLAEVQDGDIVLMHDIYDSTAEAVEILVPKLKEQGYQIVSVSELAQYKGKTLELDNAYGKITGGDQ